jgi:hypothetical protein
MRSQGYPAGRRRLPRVRFPPQRRKRRGRVVKVSGQVCCAYRTGRGPRLASFWPVVSSSVRRKDALMAVSVEQMTLLAPVSIGPSPCGTPPQPPRGRRDGYRRAAGRRYHDDLEQRSGLARLWTGICDVLQPGESCGITVFGHVVTPGVSWTYLSFFGACGDEGCTDFAWVKLQVEGK